MRRLTRRVGLFGGPGAMIKAAGGPAKTRPTSEPKLPEPVAEEKRSDEPPPESKGWFDWLLGPKRKG